MKIENKTKKDKLYKGFSMNSICRQDLVSEGIVTKEEALEITDGEMERIASKMGNAQMINYWQDLELIAEGILD